MRMYLFCIQAAVAAMVLNVAELQAGDSSVVRLTEAADSLRMEYRFKDAAAIYREASSTAADSLEKIAVEEKLLLAENGISMTGFVSTPKVVARHRFSLEDFYLFYPLEDSCWVSVPNQLDTAGANHFSRATYLSGTVASAGTGDKIYYSAPDASGAMNIYMTEYRDSLWSLPSLLTESMTSSSDEIYPMLSPDGKTMYFSSSGLYGAGGYDIYMTEWDEDASEWGEPVNLGFPYSSPYDDFLYVNTPDGKYSIFASNRDCSRDSVCVYVLEYDPMPVRKEVRDIQELRRICALDPDDALAGPNSVDTGTSVSDTMPDNVDIRRYMEKVSEVRLYRDSLYGCISSIDKDRQALPAIEYEEDRKAISDRIAANEKMIPRLQASLDRAMSDLQKIEMEFLFNGVVIDPGKIQAESDREVVGASTGFVFTKMNPGTMPEMKFEVPEKKFDYTFMILPEGRFAIRYRYSHCPEKLLCVSSTDCLRCLNPGHPPADTVTGSESSEHTMMSCHGSMPSRKPDSRRPTLCLLKTDRSSGWLRQRLWKRSRRPMRHSGFCLSRQKEACLKSQRLLSSSSEQKT